MQREWELWPALEIAADKAIVVHSQIKCSRASIIYYGRAEPLGQREDSLDTPDTHLTLTLMDGFAQGANVRSSSAGPTQQLRSG